MIRACFVSLFVLVSQIATSAFASETEYYDGTTEADYLVDVVPRIYVDPERVFAEHEKYYLCLNDETVFPMPNFQSDSRGYYFELNSPVYSPSERLKIAMDMVEMLPVKSRNDKDRDHHKSGGGHKGGGSVKGGITGEWGDGKGVRWSGYLKGEGHDEKGNYAEAEVRQYDDGHGRVDANGGYDSEKEHHN